VLIQAVTLPVRVTFHVMFALSNQLKDTPETFGPFTSVDDDEPGYAD
jgi:hypothetical protein